MKSGMEFSKQDSMPGSYFVQSVFDFALKEKFFEQNIAKKYFSFYNVTRNNSFNAADRLYIGNEQPDCQVLRKENHMYWKKVISMTLVAAMCVQSMAFPAYGAAGSQNEGVEKSVPLRAGGRETVTASPGNASSAEAASPSDADTRPASASNAKKTVYQDMFPLQVVSGYGRNIISWSSVPDATGYMISSSDSEDGIFQQLGSELGSSVTSYTDAVGADRKRFYKVTAVTADGNGESEITEADYTGLKALQKNAALNESFAPADQSFDGTRVVNVSEERPDAAAVLKGMTAGTVIMKIKPASDLGADNVILGLKDNSAPVPTSLNAANLNGKKTAAILLKQDGMVRYSFNHTRANGNSNAVIPAGTWTTVVFTNAGPQASKVLRLYAGGRDCGSYSGSQNSGFFSTTGGDTDDSSVTIGGLLSEDGQPGACFKGQIAYVTVTDELLTDSEALDISMGAGESDIIRAFRETDRSNTWVITGGRNAAGEYRDIGNARNYGGLFEDVIRGDQSRNTVNGRQRFVINTAKEGYGAASILADYDRLIGTYSPRGVAIMLEGVDIAADPSEVAEALKELIDKNTENHEAPVYTVIQLPVPSGDADTNTRIEALVQAIDGMVQGLDSYEAKKVVVDQYAGMKAEDPDRYLNRDGYLNRQGQLKAANLLLAATIGTQSPVTDADRSMKEIKLPAFLEEAPEVTIDADSITVAAPYAEGVTVWNYSIDCEGTVLKGSMGQETHIGQLPSGTDFELSMVSEDGTVCLPVMTGIIGEGETAVQKDADRELTSAQQELIDRLDSDQPVKWLFLGDSIAQGDGHTNGYDTVPQIFEKYIRGEMGRQDDTVINTGVTGGTTTSFEANQDVRYGRYQDADVVFLMFGTDDAKNGTGIGTFRQKLEAMIDEVRENGAIPVLCTPNKADGLSRLSDYVKVIREAAQDKNAILADQYELWQNNLYSRSYLNTGTKYWQDGSIAPNGPGQLVMGQNLLHALGIDRQEAPVLRLEFPIAQTTAGKGIVPLMKTTGTTITVDASWLQRKAAMGVFGSVTVTASAGGRTYTRTVKKTSISDIKSVTMTGLPTGLKYTVTVEAGLQAAPKSVRFQTRSFVLDGTVNDSIPGEIDGLIHESEELKLDGTRSTVLDLSDDVSIYQALTEGSLNFRFRVADPEQADDAGLQTLFSISDATQENIYCNFYVNPSSGLIGFEMKNGTDTVSDTAAVDIRNTNWHTAAFVYSRDDSKLVTYFDGRPVMETPSPFFLNLDNGDTVRVGDMKRANRGDHMWAFKGDINVFSVYDRALTYDEITALHAATMVEETKETLPDTAWITDPADLFYGGYMGSSDYRIPSLLTTEGGTVIAAVDQRRSGAGDAGDIATVIRRSKDGGKTWGDVQTLIDLPGGSSRDSFTIDASMVQDKNSGRVFLLVDMFPESTALMSGSPIGNTEINGQQVNSGYKEVEGRRYLMLRGADQTAQAGNIYTVRDDGTVYQELEDGTSVVTDYTVPDRSSGQLLKAGNPAGNVYLYTGSNKGDLSVVKTSYLWLISSDDDGETWSDPVCLNGQVKADWMVFLGTGPGVGIQIQNGSHSGRLVFPVYYTNKNGLNGSQSSAAIYSDDGGVTWTMGESPNDGRAGSNGIPMNTETMNDGGKILTESQAVEVGENGRLKLFCRNQSGAAMIATSDDGGATWDDTVVRDSNLYDSYCQMSIVPYPTEIDGKPAYIFSNPASSGRNNGTVRIGLYDEQTDTFDWKYSQLIHQGKYQYSSVAVMPDGDIGVFYEGDVPFMRFTRMTTDWLTAPRAVREKTSIDSVTAEWAGDSLLFNVSFSRPMIKMGSPVLNLMVDGQEKSAVYVSGSGTSEYQFLYTPAAGEQNGIAVNVTAPEGSYIGDAMNALPEDGAWPFTIRENEEIPDLDGVVQRMEEMLKDPNATGAEKEAAVNQAAAAVQAMTFTNITDEDMDQLAVIENAYVWNNPHVLEAKAESAELAVQLRGAALSIPAGAQENSRIRVALEKTGLPAVGTDKLESGAIALDIVMHLDKISGVSSEIEPLVPFEVCFQLPAGLRTENLVMLHYHDGKVESMPIQLNGREVKVILPELSVFVLGNEKQKEPDQPVKPDQPSKPSGSDSSTGAAVSPSPIYGSWIQDETGWWFKKTDGTYPAEAWGLINGRWYYFDVRGYMVTGWFQDKDQKWYYLNQDGSMAASQWILDKGKWYYVTESGAMAVNTEIPGQYRVGADGAWIQ